MIGPAARRGALLAAMALTALHGGALPAQQAAGAAAEFEVASVKPNTSGSGTASTSNSKGQTRMENITLRSCIERAFDVRDYSLSGPSWLGSERFDIVAKIPAGADRTQLGAMLQALLKDRFQLAFHWAPKEITGFALVAATKGAKIQPVDSTGHTSISTSNGKIKARQISMEEFADALGREIDLPVQNLTGMPGVFDLALEWTPDEAPAAPSGDVPAPSLFTALQDQLGLRLRAQKVSVRTLVVDHIERVPTAN
jgi:uncharacterized protein (TIGR03435 family)